MKLKTLVAALAISVAILGCEDRTVAKAIDTKELLANLDNPEYVIIDTRIDSLYNGFKDKNALRGGHIKGRFSLVLRG